MIFKVGDNPGIGRYKCTACGRYNRISKKDELLKPCYSCGNNEFTGRLDFKLSSVGLQRKLDEILTVLEISIFLYDVLKIEAFQNVIAVQLRLLLCDNFDGKDISVLPLIHSDFKLHPVRKEFIAVESTETKFISSSNLFDDTQNPISIAKWLEQEILIDKKQERPIQIFHLIKYSANKNGGAHLETSHESFALSTIIFAGNYLVIIGKYLLSSLGYDYEKDIQNKLFKNIFELMEYQ